MNHAEETVTNLAGEAYGETNFIILINYDDGTK